VSRERVRQVEAALKKKLREFLVDALGEQPPLLEDSRG
jgi:DNA-directed RNA polymerase sigma subunit (sigma70/sigma32)